VRRIVVVLTAIAAALPLIRGGPQPFPFGRLIDIAFTLDPPARAALQKNIDAEVAARMRIPDERGTLREHLISLRIKGGFGSKRALDEKPAFKATPSKGDRLFGLDQVTLNNMVQDHTMVHETLGYQFYDALGLPVPRTGYARVTVNGLEFVGAGNLKGGFIGGTLGYNYAPLGGSWLFGIEVDGAWASIRNSATR